MLWDLFASKSLLSCAKQTVTPFENHGYVLLGTWLDILCDLFPVKKKHVSICPQHAVGLMKLWVMKIEALFWLKHVARNVIGTWLRYFSTVSVLRPGLWLSRLTVFLRSGNLIPFSYFPFSTFLRFKGDHNSCNFTTGTFLRNSGTLKSEVLMCTKRKTTNPLLLQEKNNKSTSKTLENGEQYSRK